MILMKENDLIKFGNGQKWATCRHSEWNQAKTGSTHQLRVNFNLMPFGWAKIGYIRNVNLYKLNDDDISLLGFRTLGEYLEQSYNQKSDSDERKYILLPNIILNPEFPWNDFGIDFNQAIEKSETWMHFVVKYSSKIGKPCNDDIFQTKKDNLTATRIINKCVDWYFKARMADAYLKEDSDKILTILDEVISIYKYLGIKPDADWLDDHILPFSIGNDKIGEDTLCISINTAVLCYMGITGKCDNCDICYAVASNKMYTSEFLKNNISQKHFIESDADSIGFSTLDKILTKLTKKELSKLRFIRFNVNGDILNDEQLKKLDRIAEILMNGLKIKISYTYTHNTLLNLSIAENILINPSFYHDIKCCLTVDDFDASMMDDDSIVICNGHCYRCPYCKNPKERRTVIFLAHGGGKKGVKAIPDDLMRILEERKESDYLKFIEEYGI